MDDNKYKSKVDSGWYVTMLKINHEIKISDNENINHEIKLPTKEDMSQQIKSDMDTKYDSYV